MAKLALAGIVAPVLFTILVLIQGQLQPDYSHVAWPISALAAWPHGWVQNLNFYLYGSLVIAFACGLHAGLARSGWGTAGPALLGVAGVGAIVAGIFPWIRVAGVPTETAGHVAGALMHFLGGAIGLVVVSRRMARDTRWDDLAAYVLASGIAMLAVFVSLAAFALPVGAPLHPWAGGVQRVAVALWFAVLTVMAFRLLRVARGTHGAAGRSVEARP